MSETKRKLPEKILAFRLDDETHRRIAQLAKDQGVKPTTMAREIIKRTASGFDAQPMAARFSAIDEELMDLETSVSATFGIVEEQRAAFESRMDRIEMFIKLLLTINSRAAAVTWSTARRADPELYERWMKEADVALQKQINTILQSLKPKPEGAR